MFVCSIFLSENNYFSYILTRLDRIVEKHEGVKMFLLVNTLWIPMDSVTLKISQQRKNK